MTASRQDTVATCLALGDLADQLQIGSFVSGVSEEPVRLSDALSAIAEARGSCLELKGTRLESPIYFGAPRVETQSGPSYEAHGPATRPVDTHVGVAAGGGAARVVHCQRRRHSPNLLRGQ